jgi:hypothetical protein
MTEKHLKFQEWTKQIKSEWTHIPSLKGKQANRNLFILKTLMETPGHALSTWDIALEWLKETMGPKFNNTPGDTIYRRRTTENAAMYRSLRHLEKLKYVQKFGSLYKLTVKGILTLLILDSTIIGRASDSVWDIDMDVSANINKDNFEGPKSWDITFLKKMFSDPEVAGAFSGFFRRKLFALKINLDDIDSQELANFVFSTIDSKLSGVPKSVLDKLKQGS